MLLGEMYGLHTLSSILSSFHITSNNLHKIWQGFNFKQIQLLCSNYCIELFREKIVQLAKQSDSSWSRKEVTIVIDDSIFKQWLKNMPRGEHFAKFFSGQTHSTVYGFRVTLIGVGLGDEFYPLYFQLSTKEESTKEIAFKLLKKTKRLLINISNSQQIKYPNLFLSVDSGFTDDQLIKYCRRTGISFIGVPKKNNKFKIGRYEMNLKDYIETVFLKKEQEYIAECKKNSKPPKPFLLRKRAYFKFLKQSVVLILFRLNGSNKVSIIFTNNLKSSAKTLRRRFFSKN